MSRWGITKRDPKGWLRSNAVVDEKGCWIWTGRRKDTGYGQTRFNGVTTNAHRIAYQVFVGPIPEGMEIDHLCRVRACVNPDHLEPVTHSENMLRSERATSRFCHRGHERTPDNTKWWWSKRYQRLERRCATCNRDNRQAALAA